jgi:exopolysaccharide biosynthesis polyprenyl glycosylphosphotransferase
LSIAQELQEAVQAPRTRRLQRPVRANIRVVRPGEGLTEGATRPATALREGLYRRTLALADACAAGLVVLGLLPLLHADALVASVVLALPAIVLVSKVCGLYERDDLVLKKTTLDEAPRLLQMSAVFTLLLWLFHDGFTAVVLGASDVMVVWGGSFLLLLGLRGLARWIVRRVAAPERCLVVGPAESIALVRHKLQVGRVNAAVVASVPVEEDDVATSVALGELIFRHDVHRVVIAPAAAQGSETLDLIRMAKHAGVRVSVLPRLLEVVGSSVEFDHLDGLTMLGVRRFGLSRSSHALKRAFDLAGAGVALVLSAPIFLAIAIAIRLESGESVFFRQTRVGKGGRRFRMLKFRSMVHDAEERKETLRPLNEAQGLFKIADDPRITRVGRFLRRTSLDELPQLINVWRGEMSLVGPRPLVVDEDVQVRGLDRHRLHLTPGMTGHWQILGSARLPMREMVGIDYGYVANWSLWTDVKILLRTIPYVLASRGM